MKKFSKTFISFVVCAIAAALFFETEHVGGLSLYEQESTCSAAVIGTVAAAAEVSVDDMVLSSIFHKDAVVMGTNYVPGVECFSRFKGGNRSHYGNEHNPVFKDNHSIYYAFLAISICFSM